MGAEYHTFYDLRPLDDVPLRETFEDVTTGSMYKPDTIEKPIALPEITGLEHLDDDQVLEYFQGLLRDEERVTTINGTSDTILCAYCRRNIPPPEEYHYCYDCRYDLCGNCFSKTSEGIELAICRDAHDTHPRWWSSPTCDECGQAINESLTYYTTGCYDVCGICLKENPTLPEEHDGLREKWIPESVIEANNRFGNLLDWVPLFREWTKYGEAYILKCMNSENQFYHRLALACHDNHGRVGYFTCSASTTLESLLTEYSELKALSSEDDDMLEQMMINRRFDTYFG